MKSDVPDDSKPAPKRNLSADVAAAQRAILDKLIACEQKIAAVYAAYANAFASTNDFWTSLSKEETSHAAMLESVKRFLDAGHYFVDIGTVARDAESAIGALDREASMAKHGYITEPQAFNHAIGFEARLIDGHFYDIVRCGAPEFHHMASVLRQGCERHRSKIQERMLARKAEVGETWKG